MGKLKKKANENVVKESQVTCYSNIKRIEIKSDNTSLVVQLFPETLDTHSGLGIDQ